MTISSARRAILFLAIAHLAVAQDWARTRLDKSPRHRERTSLKHDGRSIDTLVILPEGRDKKPVVLVIHDNGGMNDWVAAMADEIARMGYVVVAPTLAGQKDASSDLNAVADYTRQLPSSNGTLFAVGFGWGGEQSFRFAATRQDVAAALVFYGASPDKESIAHIQGSIFGFYAGADERVNSTVAPAQAAAKAAGVVFEAVTYPGVGAGFMQSGDAPDAKPADKQARGYALERMKSVLDMVALRGY